MIFGALEGNEATMDSKDQQRGTSKPVMLMEGTGLSVCSPIPLDRRSIVVTADLDTQIHELQQLLQTIDNDQERLTWCYVDAGKRLWQISRECKAQKKKFKEVLVQEFPNQKRSTLREYMTLAKYFDAAKAETKVQLTGLFKHGWGAVLGELRRLRRIDKTHKKNVETDADVANLTILQGDCMVRLPELPAESVDCVITSVPFYRRFVFPGVTTVIGGNRSCEHDWEIRQTTRRAVRPRSGWKNRPKEGNAKDVIESGTCRKCRAEKIMLGWEDDVSQYVDHIVQVADEVKRVLKPGGVFWLEIDDTYLNKELVLIPHRIVVAVADRFAPERQLANVGFLQCRVLDRFSNAMK